MWAARRARSDFNQENAFLSVTPRLKSYWGSTFEYGLTVVCNSGSDHWSLTFAPPVGGRLWPAVFQPAFGAETDHYPYMLIYESGKMPSSPSTHIFGHFTVNSITYGASGDIQELNIDFQESNGDWGQSVSGHLQFATAPATSMGVLQGASDPGGTPLTAVLVSPPQHGTLRLDANGGFVYTPAADFYGTDSFQYKANDGFVDSASATALIEVDRIHQTPSGHDAAITLAPNAAYTFQAADFGFSDAQDQPPDAFAGVVVTTVPTAGELELGRQPVTAGQFVAEADLDGGSLTFVAPRRGAGLPDQFHFSG